MGLEGVVRLTYEMHVGRDGIANAEGLFCEYEDGGMKIKQSLAFILRQIMSPDFTHDNLRQGFLLEDYGNVRITIEPV